eukprot:TRINITY_DN2957_c0_g1_i2.p1 TRINITY_DN2957_c0_g1~~TRINITY_DN2957_c0_g1_i2.p1  ORF type:complete len:697 (+),score=236.94 TRINITY_DN2957_c0_g1_i2:324-2414(+)
MSKEASRRFLMQSIKAGQQEELESVLPDQEKETSSSTIPIETPSSPRSSLTPSPASPKTNSLSPSSAPSSPPTPSTPIASSPPTSDGPGEQLLTVVANHMKLVDGQWKPIDGGASRLAILRFPKNETYRLISMSSDKKVTIDEWITKDFRYKRLSETFVIFAISKPGEQLAIDYGLNFATQALTDDFTKVFKEILVTLNASSTISSPPTSPPTSPTSSHIASTSSPTSSPTSSRRSDHGKSESLPRNFGLTQSEPEKLGIPNSENPHSGVRKSDPKTKSFSLTRSHDVDKTSTDPVPPVKQRSLTALTNLMKPKKKRDSLGIPNLENSSGRTSPNVFRKSPTSGRSRSNTPRSEDSPTLSQESQIEDQLMNLQMEKTNLFEISLEIFNLEFSPGELVAGELFIRLLSPVKAKSVGVLFQGFDKTFNGLEGIPPKKVYFSRGFFSHRIVLWKPQNENEVLPAGTYTHTFSFQLPTDLPPSLTYEDWFFIFYQARGYVEPENPKSAAAKIISQVVVFDVKDVTRLTWTDTLTSSLPVLVSEKFKSDTISINAHLKRGNWKFGEVVAIHCKISNEYKKSFSVKIDLFQQIKLTAPNFQKEFEEVKLVSRIFKLDKFEKGISDQMRVYEIPIPVADEQTEDLWMLPTLTKKDFSVSHFFRIKINTPQFAKPSLNIPFHLWESQPNLRSALESISSFFPPC